MATRTTGRSTTTRSSKSSPSRTRSSNGERSSSGNNSANSNESEKNSNSTAQSRRSSERNSGRERSAFAFDKRDNNSGAIIGAALAGAAIGFAANYGRKLLMQGLEAQAGDWDEILAVEHDAALAIFDKMLATDSTQTFKRKMLLMKLTHALDKHAHQEEMVVYPALRQANERHDADLLETEHGEVKTYLYALEQMGADSPSWLEKVREFRSFISKHMHMEEEQVFPRFKQDLSEEQNDKITSLVNRDGFWMA
jgi:hemerythrin superfamily protein